MRIILLICFLLTGCLQAQVRTVSVSSNATLTAPTNFFVANSNLLNQAVNQSGGGGFTNAGRGLVGVGQTLHFGQSAAYTPGLVPYASATNGIGFAANLFWDSSTDRLTIGAPLAGNSRLHVVGDGTSTGGIQYGSGAEVNRLWSDGDGNVVLQFGGGIVVNNPSFTLRGLVSASPFDVLKVRSGNILDVSGNFRPLLIGPDVRIIGTDASTNLVAITLQNSDLPSGIGRDKLAVGPADALVINGADGLLSSETTLGAARFPAITGDVTTPGGSLATTITNLAKSKISTTGTWAASDIPSLDASKIGSGTLDTNRLPTLVKDLGAISGTKGDIYYYDGTNLNRLAATTSGYVLTANGSGTIPSFAPVSAGSVTSVGLALPSIFSVSGSPVTSSGTLTGTLATATANAVFAGPTSGEAAMPAFRALVAGDIPNNAIPTNGSAYMVVGGSATATANWNQLTNAYLTAQSATPHGSVLLTGNRYTIFLLPGVYDAGANTLNLSADYIDLVGLSPHAGMVSTINNSTTNNLGDTILQGSGVVISTPASVSTAQDDKMLANLTLYSTGGVTFSPGAGGTGDRFQMRNVLITRPSYAQAMADVVYRGFFYQVCCINTYAWGSGVTGSPNAKYWYCVGGDNAWSGYNGISDGKFYYCTAGRSGQPAFGAYGANGNYYHCQVIGGGAGFGSGGPFTGTAEYCSTSAGGFGGDGGTMTGTLIGCFTSGAFSPTAISGTINNSSLGGIWYHSGNANVGGVLKATNAVLTGTTLALNTTNSAATASRFATFDSAKVLSTSGASADLAATLTDETGSGAVVFSTNATLVAPTLSGASLSGTTTNTSTFSGTFTNTGAMGVSGAVTLGSNLSVVGNGAASTPGSAFIGTWFSGGTATTTKPFVLFEPTGTTSTLWNTNGSGFGVNSASGFTGDLFNFQLNGADRFKMTSDGLFTFKSGSGTGSIVNQVGNTPHLIFIQSTTARSDISPIEIGMGPNATLDTFFNRESAGVWQLGQDATAQNTPVNQLLKGPDALAGTATNINGANLSIAAGRNTGTGTGGSLLFQTSPAGSTGTAAGTLTTRLTIDSTGLATFANNAAVSGTLSVTGASTLSGAVTAASIVATNSSSVGTGTNTVFAKLGGTLKVDTTTTGNVGGGEDTLITYTIPAAVLTTAGDYIEFDTWGSFAANANTKDLKIYFGATVIFDSTALILNGVDWRGHGKIVRTGATTQKATTEFTIGGTLLGAVTTTTTTTSAPTETLANTAVFKVTGTDSGVTPVDNSIVQQAMVLKWYPNN